MLREMSTFGGDCVAQSGDNVDGSATCQIHGDDSEDSDESEEDLEEQQKDIESESCNSTQQSDDDSKLDDADNTVGVESEFDCIHTEECRVWHIRCSW